MEQATAHATAGGAGLNRLAVSATTHCLIGCAIGEFAGMAIATALSWGNFAQTALAIVLAYFFGFGLTAMPLVRAGLAAGAIVSTALASIRLPREPLSDRSRQGSRCRAPVSRPLASS
jgi:hypothetical protein